MEREPGFWINFIGWFVIALFGLALWKFTRPSPWERLKKTKKKSTHISWLKPDRQAKKWALISVAALYILLFPDVFAVLWLTLMAVVFLVAAILFFVFIVPDIFEGWSVRKFEEK